MASTSEWVHFHQNNNITIAAPITTTNNNIPSIIGQMAQPYATTSPPDLFFSGLFSESTVVSTQTTPIQPSPTRLGPAGRVTKPARRRTRASRRTPTTLLNTDTTNFRAMVQQFTGGPSPNNPSPQLSNLGSHGLNIGPGLGYGLQFPMGQLQYANATVLSSSHNSGINDNMLMRRDTVDKNIICDGYFTGGNNVNNNNNHVNGGSSSSENIGSNNSFQF